MQNNSKYIVIPASGIGSRMNLDIPKQYIKLENGKTVLDILLEKVVSMNFFTKIILALNSEDIFWQDSQFYNNQNIITCEGGATRFESVANALVFLSKYCSKDDWIFVHDAARPCITFNDIEKLYDTTKNSSSKCGILATRAFETVKSVKIDNVISQTLNRDSIWLAQTPQLAKFDLLKTAFDYCIKKSLVSKITDEASALELYNISPIVVEGSRNNIKITTQQDLDFVNWVVSNK